MHALAIATTPFSLTLFHRPEIYTSICLKSEAAWSLFSTMPFLLQKRAKSQQLSFKSFLWPICEAIADAAWQ